MMKYVLAMFSTIMLAQVGSAATVETIKGQEISNVYEQAGDRVRQASRRTDARVFAEKIIELKTSLGMKVPVDLKQTLRQDVYRNIADDMKASRVADQKILAQIIQIETRITNKILSQASMNAKRTSELTLLRNALTNSKSSVDSALQMMAAYKSNRPEKGMSRAADSVLNAKINRAIARHNLLDRLGLL